MPIELRGRYGRWGRILLPAKQFLIFLRPTRLGCFALLSTRAPEAAEHLLLIGPELELKYSLVLPKNRGRALGIETLADGFVVFTTNYGSPRGGFLLFFSDDGRFLRELPAHVGLGMPNELEEWRGNVVRTSSGSPPGSLYYLVNDHLVCADPSGTVRWMTRTSKGIKRYVTHTVKGATHIALREGSGGPAVIDFELEDDPRKEWVRPNRIRIQTYDPHGRLLATGASFPFKGDRCMLLPFGQGYALITSTGDYMHLVRYLTHDGQLFWEQPIPGCINLPEHMMDFPVATLSDGSLILPAFVDSRLPGIFAEDPFHTKSGLMRLDPEGRFQWLVGVDSSIRAFAKMVAVGPEGELWLAVYLSGHERRGGGTALLRIEGVM